MRERRSTREDLDPGKFFASAFQLLDDIKPDLLKLRSSLARKRSVERIRLDHLPNCKNENSTRCHRTRHMKRKHPHGVDHYKKYKFPKRKEKRTIIAVKKRKAYPRVSHPIHHSTDKSFDYEGMIFTPTNYVDISGTPRGVFDSIINLFKQTTRKPTSTIEGFELPSEPQPVEPTEKIHTMLDLYRGSPQFFLPRPPSNTNQFLQAVNTPQEFQSIRNEILQPINRNVTPQPASRNQILQPASRNQILQPASRNQILQPVNGNQILQPASRNQILQPVNGNQILQPASRNQILQPASRNQILQPASRNQILQPASRNQILQPYNRNQILQAVQTAPVFQTNRNQILQNTQVLQSRLPAWNESRIIGNLWQPRQFQQIQSVDIKNKFLPKYNREPYSDRNNRDNLWSRDDYATPGQVTLNKNITKSQMFSENTPIEFHNDIKGSVADNHLVSRSSDAVPGYKSYIRTPNQETARDVDLLKPNRAAQVLEAHNRASVRQNDIQLEIMNASREAEIHKARLDQYLNNYYRRHFGIKPRLIDKRNPNERIRKKKERQNKPFQQKTSVTLKPT